jgi:hypothetical protein
MAILLDHTLQCVDIVFAGQSFYPVKMLLDRHIVSFLAQPTLWQSWVDFWYLIGHSLSVLLKGSMISICVFRLQSILINECQLN